MGKKQAMGDAVKITLLTLLSALLMGAFVDRGSGWYTSLRVSPFQPEGSVISLVFLLLYPLTGFSLFWLRRRGMAGKGEYAGLCHLAALPCVSYLFFATRNPVTALMALCFCVITAILTALWGSRYSRIAAYLWIFEILWLCMMLVFLYAIVMLN